MSTVESVDAHHAPPRMGFADRVSQLLDEIDIRLMQTDEQRKAVGRLRYDCYLREGAISRNSSRTFSDAYDEKGDVRIFGLYLGDELASSIRIHVASKENPVFPSFSVFRDLLEPELQAGKKIIDPTRFVTEPRLSRLYPGLPHVTVRLCWMAAEHFEAEHFLAAVRVEHQAFYRRIFEQRPICGPRRYPMLSKPITLMTVNYEDAAERVHRRYPFFRSTYFERRMLFGQREAAHPLSLQPALMPVGKSQLEVSAQAG